MILADTSVWMQHFRRGLPEFAVALREGFIAMHPVVLGELASGNLSRRLETLAALRQLPRTDMAQDEECLTFLEANHLYGRGIGWNDVQLLAAARLSRCPLWSLDERLTEAARRFGLEYSSV